MIGFLDPLLLQMREVLSKFVDQAVRYDPKLCRLQVKYQLSACGIDEVNLYEVLEALDVSQLISFSNREMSRNLRI